MEAIGHIGPAAATPEMLAGLAELLRDTDCARDAVEAIGHIGPTAATPEMLAGLAELLRDTDCARDAVEAIGHIGPLAATPEMLAGLAELLRDTDCARNAVEAIGHIGPAAATPEMLARLAELLRDTDCARNAVEAIGHIGPAAATPEILTRLAELLRDNDCAREAAEAIGHIGPTVVTPEIVSGLAKLRRHWDPSPGVAAADAVGHSAAVSAATPENLARLAERLRNERDSDAAEAVGRIGPAAATPEILTGLLEFLLRNFQQVPLEGGTTSPAWIFRLHAVPILYPRTREAVERAFGQLGPLAATPAFLSRLAEFLTDGNWCAREAAVEALRGIGPAAARPEFLTQLAEILRGEHSDVRAAAAEAVGRIGPAAATPEILTPLAELLGDKDLHVRDFAMEAVGRIGPAAARPELLTRLAELFRDKNPWTLKARNAARTVAKITVKGIRIFRAPDDTWYGRQVSELSEGALSLTNSPRIVLQGGSLVTLQKAEESLRSLLGPHWLRIHPEARRELLEAEQIHLSEGVAGRRHILAGLSRGFEVELEMKCVLPLIKSLQQSGIRNFPADPSLDAGAKPLLRGGRELPWRKYTLGQLSRNLERDSPELVRFCRNRHINLGTLRSTLKKVYTVRNKVVHGNFPS